MLWLDKLAWRSWIQSVRNGVQASIKRMSTRGTKLRRTLVSALGLSLLAIGKPFTKVGNWFWRRHRAVLNWNKD